VLGPATADVILYAYERPSATLTAIVESSVGLRVTRRALVVAALLGAAALGVQASPSGAARPLTTSFTDDVYFEAPAVQGPWIQRTLATGAKLVLLNAYWTGTAPANPRRGFDATDPSDPQYSWGSIDYAVRALVARGLSVALMVTDAPRWAEGPGMPASAAPGTWRPNATAYGEFATAIARRYSGSFPDPANPGATLPRVTYWQAWAEPNLTLHLAPQWTRTRRGYVATSPVIYRSLLNAFYAGVKRVHSDNVVVTAGTGPFGDPGRGGQRMAPAFFVRELLCLHGQALRPERCPNPAHFDALAHHPYEVGSPFTKALNTDDVSAPDLAKLTRSVNKSVRTGRALPRGRKRLWITEFSYDSNPPNPQAVSTATQARWLEESFYVFWRQGVDTVVWYLIRDQAPIPDYASAYESGVYLRDGTPKPSLQAFRFPFVVEPTRRGSLAWGRAPIDGTVQIERQTGASWTVVAQIPVAAGDVFERSLGPGRTGTYRAVVGTETSLAWIER
jgi:hypothetical protein